MRENQIRALKAKIESLTEQLESQSANDNQMPVQIPAVDKKAKQKVKKYEAVLLECL